MKQAIILITGIILYISFLSANESREKQKKRPVIINAGGIVAYYPSKIPLHRHAQYLNGK